MEEWLTVQELIQRTGIPETTLRRYLRLFEDCLLSRKKGRIRKYPPETSRILLRIEGYLEQGLSDADITARLNNELSPKPAWNCKNANPAVPSALTGILEQIATLLEEIEEQDARVEPCREEQHKGQNCIENEEEEIVLKKQKELEERDRWLVERARNLLKERREGKNQGRKHLWWKGWKAK